MKIDKIKEIQEETLNLFQTPVGDVELSYTSEKFTDHPAAHVMFVYRLKSKYYSMVECSFLPPLPFFITRLVEKFVLECEMRQNWEDNIEAMKWKGVFE